MLESDIDSELYLHTVSDAPKMNDDLCRGYARVALKDVVSHIDRVSRSASKSFPDCLTYKHIRVMTPEEEYQRTILREDANKRIHDLAESDLFMTEITFQYERDGVIEEIPRPLYLPFVRQAGMMYIKGSLAIIHPVLADRLFSVTEKGLFVIIQRAKFTLDRLMVHFYQDEETVTKFVVKAPLYNQKSAKKENASHASPTTGHYTFSVYGVTETFKRYFNSDVLVRTKDEVTADGYDGTEYALFRSSRRVSSKQLREFTQYVLLVPRKDLAANPDMLIAIAHFFYVTDIYNTSFVPADIDTPHDWAKTLGYAIFKERGDLTPLLQKVEKHLRSLDDYVDDITREEIQREGIQGVETIYDFLMYIQSNIDKIMASVDPGSMWGKYLMVKRYALSPITFRIFNLGWELSKQRPESLTPSKVIRNLSQFLHQRCFLNITKGHGEKQNYQYPGDNMVPKHTCILVRQIDAVTTPNGKNKVNAHDSSYWFHPSIFECGSVTNQTKTSVDGRNKGNPYMLIDDNGMLVRNPEFIDVLDQTGRETTLNKEI